jgi:Fe2+ transport system protein FeoA
MMYLNEITLGSSHRILNINAHQDSLQHLSHLGFRPGVSVTLISHLGQSVVVALDGTRYGLDLALAKLIQVEA